MTILTFPNPLPYWVRVGDPVLSPNCPTLVPNGATITAVSGNTLTFKPDSAHPNLLPGCILSVGQRKHRKGGQQRGRYRLLGNPQQVNQVVTLTDSNNGAQSTVSFTTAAPATPTLFVFCCQSTGLPVVTKRGNVLVPHGKGQWLDCDPVYTSPVQPSGTSFSISWPASAVPANCQDCKYLIAQPSSSPPNVEWTSQLHPCPRVPAILGTGYQEPASIDWSFPRWCGGYVPDSYQNQQTTGDVTVVGGYPFQFEMNGGSGWQIDAHLVWGDTTADTMVTMSMVQVDTCAVLYTAPSFLVPAFQIVTQVVSTPLLPIPGPAGDGADPVLVFSFSAGLAGLGFGRSFVKVTHYA